TILFAVVLGWLVSLGLGTATALADNFPVLTESFESLPGLPVGWKFVEWVPGSSTAAVISGAAADGTHFLRIDSPKPNHARVVVPVRVIPHTSYQFLDHWYERKKPSRYSGSLRIPGKRAQPKSTHDPKRASLYVDLSMASGASPCPGRRAGRPAIGRPSTRRCGRRPAGSRASSDRSSRLCPRSRRQRDNQGRTCAPSGR